MLIRFLRGFRSRHTGENFYEKGVEAEFDTGAARALIAEGAAEFVPVEVRKGQVEPAAEPKVEPKPTPKAPIRRRR